MGPEMNVDKVEEAVKMVMEHMADNQDVLVHCKQGMHCSGSFLCFVTALIDERWNVKQIMDDYLEDLLFQLHDGPCLWRLWRESGLWDVLGKARTDSEIHNLVADIKLKMDILCRSPRVQVSRSGL